jgi:methionyl-tRNA formyltransferase
MRVVCLGTAGVISQWPFEALAVRHEIVALVRPASSPSPLRRSITAMARLSGLRQRDPLERWARERRVPVIEACSGRDGALATSLQQLRPDLLCVSTFRWLVAPAIYSIPRFGALNLHSSLLPRHRGPVPLFWIYYHDDRETGVSVHRLAERADAGDVLMQEAFPLPRGFSVERLNEENARRGAGLLVRAVDAIASGTAAFAPQDESRATAAPPVRRATAMVCFEEWDVERVWHFLAGLYPRFREPLSAGGRAVAYRGVEGYERTSETQRPGTVVPAVGGWHLHCRGGVVRLRAAEAGCS